MVTVALDAGHGGFGVTPGKRSPNGEYEWHFNDTVTVACQQRLQAHGVKVVRVDDPTGRTDVSLEERVRRINNSKADLMCSIHANANTGRWSNGWGGTETWLTNYRNPYSLQAANQIHPRMVKAMGLQDRGIKRADFYVIRWANMPGMLVEIGFMDSTIDIVKLRNKTVLRNTGIAIADGMLAYFGIKVKSGAGTSTPAASKPAASKPAASTDKLYRVRKTWADSKSQVGAYKSLSSAIKIAEGKSGYKVFDHAGKQAWPKTAMYRLRKSWGDEKSQIGAFKELKNAKERADQTPGINVYDAYGKKVYTGKKQTETLYRVRKTWKDEKSQKGAFKNLASAKELADKHSGYHVFDAKGKSVHKSKKANAPKTDGIYRVRKTWSDAKSQKGAYKNLDSAKEVADKELLTVFDSNGKQVYKGKKVAAQPVKPKEPVKTEKPTATKKTETVVKKEDNATKSDAKGHEGHTPIMGEIQASKKQMKAFLHSVNPEFADAEEVIDAFLSVGKKYGVRGDIAFCQSLIETGWFKFTGGTAVTPDQHNYCGMGVTSKGLKGNSFDTVVDGVTAQIQHLYGYATTKEFPDEKILSPRLKYVTRGIAPDWEDLSMRWAMNESYGTHILQMYQNMMNFEAENKEDIKDTPKAKEEINVSKLNKVVDLVLSFFNNKK